jgi:polysaccharide export outer membrane protein
MTNYLRLPVLLALCGLVAGRPVAAQTAPLTEARLDMRRAQATRVELQASLVQIDSILQSPGYSSRIREAKRREAQLIRERLTEGDLQVGDQVQLTVLNEEALSGTFAIGAGRVLSLPGLPEITVRGILRSEAENYLTEQLRRFVRDPSVRVQTSIRMSVLGAVGKQGFYQIPADVLISDAIMLAGGPAGTANPNKTVIRRAGNVLYTQAEVSEALLRGTTLDQLNLRAGDEVVVDIKQVPRNSTVSVLTIIGALSTLTFIGVQIFR